MSELPVALTFDLDPDVFDSSVSSTEGRTRLGWRCITEGIDLIRQRLAAFSDDFGNAPRPTWFVRVDNQIAEYYGRPAQLLVEHSDRFHSLRDAGEEIGWHPHLYRAAGGCWVQETDDAVLAELMTASHADMVASGFEPRCARIGEAYGSSGIMSSLDRLGLRVDSTAMPGRRRVDAERQIDWADSPARPYRPSKADHRVPGEPAHNLLEIPMSMLQVRAEYDAAPLLRYLDISFRTSSLAGGLDALLRRASYLVTVTHPSALLADMAPAGGHGLISFDPEQLTANLALLKESASKLGRKLRFLTLSELAQSFDGSAA